MQAVPISGRIAIFENAGVAMQVTVQTAIIGLLGVFLGAAMGFFGNARIANKNLKKEISLKIAEYRLQWINNLNEEFSRFNSSCLMCVTLSGEEKDEIIKSIGEQYRCFTKIMLLMNHKDEDYAELTEIMRSMMTIDGLASDKIKQNLAYLQIGELSKKFVLIANRILKREWNKTKEHLRLDTVAVEALKSSSKSGYIYRTVDAANRADDTRAPGKGPRV